MMSSTTPSAKYPARGQRSDWRRKERRPRAESLISRRASSTRRSVPLYDSLVANEVAWAEGAGVRAIAPDGTRLGPFNPLLFSPALGNAQVGVFRADKTGTSLSAASMRSSSAPLASMAIGIEQYAHSAVAKVAGLPDAVIRALASGQSPVFESEEETTAHAFACSSPTNIVSIKTPTQLPHGPSATRVSSIR